MNTRTKTLGLAAGAAALTLFVTACGGSQVSPETAAAANAAAAGGANAAGNPGAVAAPGTSGSGTVSTPVAGGSRTTGGGSGTAAPAGGTSGGTSSGNAPKGSGQNAATGGVTAASCDGLKNQTGVTASEIRLANVADVSGPVPGLFAAARQGAQAYVAYFNSTSNICGRKLVLDTFDTRTDAGGDQTSYAKACDQDFAAVGSISILDSGGAGTTQACGLPDIRSIMFSQERAKCPVCYAAQSTEAGVIADGGYKAIKKRNPEIAANAAFLYLNTGGSPITSQTYAEVAKASGWNVKYISGIDVAEFNYGPYVQQMKSKGIKYVSFLAATPQAVRLAQAMKQANFKPSMFVLTQAQYTKEFVTSGGSAVDGSTIPLPHVLFQNPNAEMKLYLQWLGQVNPGAQPDTQGLFAWSATRLFVEKALGLGGKLTRQSMITALKNEHNWTAHGLHLAMDVGSKSSYKCSYSAILSGGNWRLESNKPTCGNLVRTKFAK